MHQERLEGCLYELLHLPFASESEYMEVADENGRACVRSARSSLF